ncbi:MAG: hypothetical protein AAF039_05070 [Bacteroidota bacterium]
MRNPKTLLFHTTFGTPPEVLFKSQVKIGKLIKDELEKQGQVISSKGNSSLLISLNNAINGKRRMSKNLKNGFSLVLDSRLQDFEDGDSIKASILHSLEQQYQSFEDGKVAPDKKAVELFKFEPHFKERLSNLYNRPINENTFFKVVFEEFLRRGERATNVVCTSPCPGELAECKTAQKMLDFISNAIGLTNEKNEKTKYTYFFPKKDGDKIAIDFWKKIYLHNKMFGVKDVDKKLENLNKKGFLKVYSVDDEVTSHAVTCFNYSDRSNEYVYYTNMNSDMLMIMPSNECLSNQWREKIKEVYENRHRFEVKFIKALNSFKNRSIIPF